MRHVLAIAGRELRSIFSTPVAYVLISTYMLITGFLFFSSLGVFLLQIQQIQAMGMTHLLEQWNLNDNVIGPSFSTATLLLGFLIPLLCMRAIAEERATGSIELLLTSPITSWSIVIGKYLAILAVVALVVALTGAFPALLMLYGEPEVMRVLSGLMMLFFYAAGLSALCCFISGLTRSQIVAAFVGIVVVLVLLLLPYAAESTQNASFKSVLRWLSTSTHFQQGLRGQVRTQDLVYFGSMIFVFLSLARAAAESLRWR